MVFRRLITLLIHVACPITPISLPLLGVRGRRLDLEGDLLASFSAPSVELDMLHRQCLELVFLLVNYHAEGGVYVAYKVSDQNHLSHEAGQSNLEF